MGIIAEMCQNHNGDEILLREMVFSAVEAGASIVKFQYINASMLSERARFEDGEFSDTGRTVAIKRPFQLEYERLKKLEISEQCISDLAQECYKRGVTPMCTSFTIESLPLVSEMGFKVLKVASYDCGSAPFLRKASDIFDKIFISTGASFKSEIENISKLVQQDKLSLMHCVTIYPTPLEKLNLKKIEYLKNFCPRVGYSDHSSIEKDGLKAAIAARYFGGQFLERHFSIIDVDKTRDGVVSVNHNQLKTLADIYSQDRSKSQEWLLEHFPESFKMFENLSLNLSEQELLNRDYYRGRFISRHKDGSEYLNYV